MIMFKKLLASVGIGAAKVDTVLNTEHLLPGQIFNAEIIVMGGDVEQEISGLELALMTKAKVENDDGYAFHNHVLQSWRITDKFTIAPDEVKKIPFSAQLHPETPITEIHTKQNHTLVWLATGLNIDMAVDPSDMDPIFVYPNDVIKACMNTMEAIGYNLVKADVEKGYINSGNFNSQSGCYQEMEYKPSGFGLFGINEVEFSFIPEAHQTHVLIELDRAFRNDGYVSLSFHHDEASIASIHHELESLLK